MNPDAWKRAWNGVALAIDIVKAIVEAARRGEPERVDHILPEELRTTVAKRLADERARVKFAKESEIVEAGTPGGGHL